jgi:hypothetical protein
MQVSEILRNKETKQRYIHTHALSLYYEDCMISKWYFDKTV